MAMPTEAAIVPLSLALSPGGRLHVSGDPCFAAPLPAAVAGRIEAAFAADTGRGLLHLGVEETAGDLGPTAGYWRDIAKHYLTKLFTSLDVDERVTGGPPIPLEGEEVRRFLDGAPPMLGIEYLSEEVLREAWRSIGEALAEEVRASGKGAADFLHDRNPLWRGVGRVTFHLAENRSRTDRPFAFLATYTSRISAQGKVQHVPLGRAVKERADAASREGLLALLAPVREAAEGSPFLRELVDSGRVFGTLAWTPAEAHLFLRDAPLFEEKGISVRVPDWWSHRNPPRVRVGVTVGKGMAAGLGAEAILDFSVGLTLDGEPISDDERRRILEGAGGLALVKGRWVEVDRERLGELLEHWKAVEREAGRSGLSFIEGMRMLARLPTSAAPEGPGIGAGGVEDPARSGWLAVEAGPWLRGMLEDLRRPGAEGLGLPADALRTTLRPYQVEGVKWLRLLRTLRLGGCLADDMGLGKTVQVIALLLLIQREAAEGRGERRRPALLVIPASLIGNWKAECSRFAPGLRLLVAHPSELEAPLTAPPSYLGGMDLVVTTYGMVARQPWMAEVDWGLVVLDEAQAIKNPSTRQARAVKALRSLHRLALTGTPIENRLSDLWSIFDFLNPGLLGSAREFSRLTGGTGTPSGDLYGRVRAMVRPYLLRRLKTDRRIIADLPDKQEMKVYCGLRKTQAVLYEEAVGELSRSLREADGMKRRGLILAFLTRLKQICNHPSQWTGDRAYDPGDSGKMTRLLELCEEIASRQEKALVFTQYKELTPVLESALERVFPRPGSVLDGDTPVRKRKDLVDAFQREDGPPFMVLSLKAGGTGLNLTAASHVIHFDRWWNPAVENQATDRAYRIGQKRNVLVHKFVCRGTVEEKIDGMLEAKQGMSDEVLRDGAEAVLTELGNEELIRLVTLDTKTAVAEA
jgi:superfamily II DNA or RNA helicase